MEAKERILVGIRLLDHPLLTTGSLTVTGFGRLVAPQDEYLKGMLSSGKLGWYVSVCEGGNDDWGETEGMCMGFAASPWV